MAAYHRKRPSKPGLGPPRRKRSHDTNVSRPRRLIIRLDDAESRFIDLAARVCGMSSGLWVRDVSVRFALRALGLDSTGEIAGDDAVTPDPNSHDDQDPGRIPAPASLA